MHGRACKQYVYRSHNKSRLSILCILIEILSRAHAKREKSLNDFKCSTSVGRSPRYGAASTAVKGLTASSMASNHARKHEVCSTLVKRRRERKKKKKKRGGRGSVLSRFNLDFHFVCVGVSNVGCYEKRRIKFELSVTNLLLSEHQRQTVR